MENPEIHNLKRVGIIDVSFGSNMTVIEPVNLYGCKFGDDCFVGPFVEIQRGAILGNRCRIQSHAFICELVTIGDDVFVSHGVKFVNDLFQSGGPAGGDRAKWAKTEIGNHVSLGTNATILPVRIVDHVVVGAGSVVTHDLLEPGVYAGNPAKFIRAINA